MTNPINLYNKTPDLSVEKPQSSHYPPEKDKTEKVFKKQSETFFQVFTGPPSCLVPEGYEPYPGSEKILYMQSTYAARPEELPPLKPANPYFKSTNKFKQTTKKNIRNTRPNSAPPKPRVSASRTYRMSLSDPATRRTALRGQSSVTPYNYHSSTKVYPPLSPLSPSRPSPLYPPLSPSRPSPLYPPLSPSRLTPLHPPLSPSRLTPLPSSSARIRRSSSRIFTQLERRQPPTPKDPTAKFLSFYPHTK